MGRFGEKLMKSHITVITLGVDDLDRDDQREEHERNRLADLVLEQPPMKLIVRPAVQEVEVRFQDRPLLLYSMVFTNYKPYVKELRTLGGHNLLLDAPPDHRHHHGLMYAITVNGTNFWEEQTDPGVQRAATPARFINQLPDGRWRALFGHPTVWLAGQRATSSGVPWATMRPPASPPSGPRSITQSAVLMTSRLCSMTSRVLPEARSLKSTSSSLDTSWKCRPVVGSSRM